MPKLKETVKELIKKAKKEEVETVETTQETTPLAPAFDPDIPEQKQRWFR